MLNIVTQYTAEGYREVSATHLYGRGSTLGDGVARYEGGYHATTAEDMFGVGSELMTSTAVEGYDMSLVSLPLFQTLVVATLVAYLYVLLRSWHFIGSIWGGVFSGNSERLMAYMGGELPLQRFKLSAAIIGGVVLALSFVRLTDGYVDDGSSIYTGGVSSYAPIVAMLFVVVILAWFYSLHKVVEWVTRSDIASQLSAIGYLDFVRSVVLLYPLVVVWLLSDTTAANWSSTAVVVGVTLLAILYVKDTFLLFIGKKISILYWILYLCTAILLPLSFLARLLPEHLG
ncbi:MAG: DUF4271 domain-containing protein [Alistipes sp.]|nr:DUF4271 domain-containing protein [Alistipes sp.]